MTPLLDIQDLSVTFGTGQQPFYAVEHVNMHVDSGEIVGIVGESGSGKSVLMMALMGLIDAPGRVTAKRMEFDGKGLLTLFPRERRRIVGKDIAMVFQDPMTSLDPSYTVGYQIKEVLKVHLGLRGAALEKRALELMDKVEIPDAAARLHAYPHELSGGMSQRVAIAMAIAAEPKLLIADEPTTALDVTIQAQIMDLLVSLQKAHQMALIMITHDLALVAQMASRIEVMYAGQVAERGDLPVLFDAPAHPYTEALLASIPELNVGAKRLKTLLGIVPGQYDRPAGCLLSPRCPYAQGRCRVERPELRETIHGAVACHYALNNTIRIIEEVAS